jgi:TolB-like protein/Flp pilus assembly protein TadD
MGNFFAELKRRHIYRVAAAYAVVAWLLLQLVNNVTPLMRLPDWAGSFFLVALLVGFPIALVFAWIHELNTPESGAAQRASAGSLDWVLIMALVAVLAAVSYQQLASSRATVTANPQAGVEAARAASAVPAGISVAVLPFVNLSQDKDQEFFSDGITEDIVTALAKIPDLRVVARESAFQYKGEKNDMRTVGHALNATHIIGGSVRKVGARVRITAQLVKADDGVNIWADSYDRELIDVFAIQEGIARAIATSLRMPLGLKPGENLVSNRPKDQETYELYLRGVNALRQRTRQELELLGQVVERDPNYAPGWAMLSEARREMGLYYERGGEESKRAPLIDGAEVAARKALALAPDYAGSYSALAGVDRQRGKWTEAMDLFKQGLARDPDHPELLQNYAFTLRMLGYLKEALIIMDRVTLLEPLIGLYNRQRAETLLTNGMLEAGLNELQRLDGLNGQGRPAVLWLWAALAEQGRFADAADALVRGGPSPRTSGPFAQPLIDAAAQVMQAAANKTEPPTQLPAFYSELFFAYAYTPMAERMLEWPAISMKKGVYDPLRFVWWPTPSSVRKTDQFKKLVHNAGLVEYWKARGWPDLCHATTGDDFECN